MERQEMPAGRKLLFSLVVVVLFFLLLEGAARIFTSGGGTGIYETHKSIIEILGLSSMNELMEFDSRLFWRLKTDVREKRIAGTIKGAPVDFTVSTNDLGLRGGGRTEKGDLTVLAVGNSCTFGVGVDDDETWPAMLERVLRERDGIDAEVLNAGVPGYTSFQGMRWLDDVGLGLVPDLVIACFGFNDVDAWSPDGDGDTARRLAAGGLDRSLSHSRFYRWMAGLLRRGGESPPDEERRARVDAGEFRANLTEMNRLCASRGARLMLLVWPFQKQRERREPEPIVYQPIILGVGASERVPVIDLVPLFVDAEPDVFLDHIHANETGCSLAAETVASALRRARVR